MIPLSIGQHRSDAAKLAHSREVHEGRLTEALTRSYYPYFFTRDAATVALNGIYRGGSCFLIGGGPSFASVPKGDLPRVWTMTLNNAHASFRGNANCTVDDPTRFNLSMWLD